MRLFSFFVKTFYRLLLPFLSFIYSSSSSSSSSSVTTDSKTPPPSPMRHSDPFIFSPSHGSSSSSSSYYYPSSSCCLLRGLPKCAAATAWTELGAFFFSFCSPGVAKNGLLEWRGARELGVLFSLKIYIYGWDGMGWDVMGGVRWEVLYTDGMGRLF